MKYLSLIIILLAACAPAPAPIEVTRVSIQTVEVVITTAPLPTYTPYPTYTMFPSLTPTPVFYTWSADQVIDAFTAAGLEVGSYRPMTDEDYGYAPNVDVGAIRFLIPSICPTCGGRILSYDDPVKMRAVFAYYDSLSQGSTALFSWLFTKDNILVQINGSLPEDKAMPYKQALEDLK